MSTDLEALQRAILALRPSEKEMLVRLLLAGDSDNADKVLQAARVGEGQGRYWHDPVEAREGMMKFTVETDQEQDGRWIAEISELPGVMKYGETREAAVAQAEALALRVVAERIEHGDQAVQPVWITFVTA